MFKQIIIAAAALATLPIGTAVAAAKEPTTTADAPANAPSDKTRYCMKSEPVTGTILQARTCKTLAEWKTLGVDPTKKLR